MSKRVNLVTGKEHVFPGPNDKPEYDKLVNKMWESRESNDNIDHSKIPYEPNALFAMLYTEKYINNIFRLYIR